MNRRPISFLLVASFVLLLFAIVPATALAQIDPKSGYEAEELADPDSAPMAWVSSMAYYDGRLIYAGRDGNVRAFDPDTGQSEIVADPSAYGDFTWGPAGFMVSDDGYLYFGDNTFPPSGRIYRVHLSDSWPVVNVETLDTGADKSIFSFAQNPVAHTIWFASKNYPAGDTMYLHEIPLTFTTVTERYSFPVHDISYSGNGPIIFLNGDALLYGESVWGGGGYFHRLDLNSAARDVTMTADYLTFDGGLLGAVRGFDDKIYVTTSAGMEVYRISGENKTLVATTDLDAQALAFDGETLFISLQKSSDFSGEIHFGAITKKPDTGGGGGGGGGGCFVRSTAGHIPKAGVLSVLLCLAGALLALMVFRAAGQARSRARVD